MLMMRMSRALGRSARGAPSVTLSRRFSGAAGGGLSFQLTDDQAAFKQAARDFAKDVIIPQAAELDRTMKVHWLPAALPEALFLPACYRHTCVIAERALSRTSECPRDQP